MSKTALSGFMGFAFGFIGIPMATVFIGHAWVCVPMYLGLLAVQFAIEGKSK